MVTCMPKLTWDVASWDDPATEKCGVCTTVPSNGSRVALSQHLLSFLVFSYFVRCWFCEGRIPRHRHRHPREDPREDVGVVECGFEAAVAVLVPSHRPVEHHCDGRTVR